jgi:tetratricopeptide (TPR) repeat protein
MGISFPRAAFAAVLNALLFALPAPALLSQAASLIVTGVKSESLSRTQTRLSWMPPQENADSVYLYVSSAPIRDSSSLASAELLAVLPPHIAEYVDKNENAPARFYAVIAVFDGVPFELVIPSLNATSGVPALVLQSGGVRAEQNARIEGYRPVPLPPLAQEGQPSKALDKSVADALPAAKNSTAPKFLAPHIFSQEQTESVSGENFLLYDIVSRDFVAGDYERALEQIGELLRITRSAALTNRAEFYRGECHYFLGNYRAAVKSFLFTKTAHPDLSNRWLDAALDNMETSVRNDE